MDVFRRALRFPIHRSPNFQPRQPTRGRTNCGGVGWKPLVHGVLQRANRAIATTGTGTLEFPTSASNSARMELSRVRAERCVHRVRRQNIGRIPTSGALAVQEFPVPTTGEGPYGITAADRGLWFTESHGNNAGLISSLGGSIRELPIPSPNSLARGITADQSGTVWFTECTGGNVGRIPESFASVTEFSLGGGDPQG